MREGSATKRPRSTSTATVPHQAAKAGGDRNGFSASGRKAPNGAAAGMTILIGGTRTARLSQTDQSCRW